MGTILQEIGHDSIIQSYIDSVLSKKIDGGFFLITAALGPKRDIFYFDESKKRYISAWNTSKEKYIPEFYYRIKLDDETLERMNAESEYQKEIWYSQLSKNIGSDLKNHLSRISKDLEKELGSDLPDILGFDSKGKLCLIGEIKFEGFSTKAKSSVLKEFDAAKSRDIEYSLVIPKNPTYASELTMIWIKNNLPDGLIVYKFNAPKHSVIPKQSQVAFERIK